MTSHSGQPASKASAVAATDEGFRSLYNGVDFSGWKFGPEHADHWKATDWTISFDGQGTHLWSEEEFGDFELHFQVKVDDGLNSGVQIRSRLKTAEDVAAMKNTPSPIKAASGRPAVRVTRTPADSPVTTPSLAPRVM